MAYASFADVKARAGRVAGTLSVAGKHPNQSDVETILDDVSALIDSAISSRGFDPAAIDDGVKDSLRDLAAYGALSRVLPAVDASAPGLAGVKAKADSVWETGIAAIDEGRHAAILELEAGQGGTVGAGAGSLWSDNADVIAEAPITRDQTF